jgi:hypothetical protein
VPESGGVVNQGIRTFILFLVAVGKQVEDDARYDTWYIIVDRMVELFVLFMRDNEMVIC